MRTNLLFTSPDRPFKKLLVTSSAPQEGKSATVISLGIGTEVNVRRGVDGTGTDRHATTVTVWIGNPDQFYAADPFALPTDPISVYPYINILTGAVWVPQGDETGSGVAGRTWQLVTTTQTFGALGIRQTATNTPT